MEKIEFVKEFTDIYRNNAKNKYLREAKCNYFMHSQNRMEIKQEDYYISSFPNTICGFGSRGSGFIYYCKTQELEKVYHKVEESKKKEIRDLIDFWQNENDIINIRKEYPKRIQEFMPEDVFDDHYYTAYPLYRFGGVYLDFSKLVDLGVAGLIKEVEQKISEETNEFLEASLVSLQYLRKLIMLYRDDAKGINEGIYHTLNTIIDNPPTNMRQAIQLIWIYVGVSEVRNYGRMDIMLSKFAQDADSYQCILQYFKAIQQRNTIFNGRIILGGKDRKNVEAEDKICSVALKVMKQEHFTEPQLTLRCYSKMSPDIYNLAFECIAEGCSYPLLYNDEINIPNATSSFEVSTEDAENYVPFGCGEYVLDHKSIGSPNGIINLAKVLEGVINNGKCLLTNQKITKYHVNNPKSFEELINVFKKELDYEIDVLAQQEAFEYQYMNKRCGYIYNSILYDHCISRGKSILNGGIDYLGGTLETYGNVNASDSLWAIKELVFDKKKVSFTKMVDILKDNFDGNEDIHKQCLQVTKYGNDSGEIDDFVNQINQYVALQTKEKAKKYALSSYLIVIINNQANSNLGVRTAASFDGRKAHQPLANALTPQAGAEHSGITAVLNTVSSLDVNNMAGAVYNLKLSKEMANTHLEAVKQLINAYFQKGGSQVMISVLNKGELEDAIVHPEKYPNLVVRVGGFSARFIDLDPLVQREVISRTMY